MPSLRPPISVMLRFSVLVAVTLQIMQGTAFVPVSVQKPCCRLPENYHQVSSSPHALGVKPTWSGDKGEPSYSDNWLLQFHNSVQKERILMTSSLQVYNEREAEEQESIREWQESFQRNGLADFTPPMSFGLSCLMVGEDISSRGGNLAKDEHSDDIGNDVATSMPTKLPWEEEPESEITSLQVVVPEKMEQEDGPHNASLIQTRLVNHGVPSTSPDANTALRVPHAQAAVYDCIVDQGLLGTVLALTPPGSNINDESTIPSKQETVKELLLEASFALREHGIYVLNTQSLSKDSIEMLQELGQETGLEWQFELDGISNQQAQVSVARRFNNGAMPKVGRLSRYQP